ncbi:S8 family serine peptidase [Clostridium sp. P21]|uniref:S8 family serine peptidase n=1 Tax=Clostridium muellerianum TaxID=2716538 RepID=A0A7Y0EJ31_9CLOT|nr:S8 family serine peptidase [Clostridium muellerianum]NMM64404.1 S8 family serine peptidase [Clostridium muellerianum]
MKQKKYIGTLLIVLLLNFLCGVTVFASTPSQSSTKKYIIKFKTNSTDKGQVISKYNGKSKQQFKYFNAATAEMTTQNIDKLKKDSTVDYVEEDNVVKISSTSIVKSSASMTNWGVNDINAPASWQSGLTGKGVKIAIIDSGIASHSDLAIAGGTNVITGSSGSSYTDQNGHGTHVAGVIAAQGLNGGVKGVAPDASIYAVKALDSSGQGYTSDIIAGIDWAMQNKMDIISMSMGTNETSTALKNAIDTAYNNGILVVAAAGNDGNTSGTGTSIEYPANYPSVIAVGAVDSSNTRAYFSSTGSKLEVSAPGVDILSTYLNNGYAKMSGTSMATPFVTGDLALLKQKYPSYTNLQLRQMLDSNVKDLGTSGKDSLYGYGLIVAPGSAATTTTTVSTPIASVAAGTYTTSQTVSLSDATSGVSIYYTLDGTTPTSSSKLYSSPIIISSTTTLKAVAIDNSGNSSSVLSVLYTISQSGTTPKVTPTLGTIPTPTASVPSGSYRTPLTVTLYDRYSKPLKAYYTLDGSTPTTNSTLYTGYIKITTTSTLKAIAVDSSGNTSGVLSNSYTIVTPPANPTASVRSGLYLKAQNITLSDITPGVSIYYTTDRTMPTSKSNLYTGPITIKNNTTLAMIAIDSSGNASQVVVAQYIILNR